MVMKFEKSTGVGPKIVAKEDLEIIKLSNDTNISKPVSIYTSLSVVERNNSIGLLKEYQDVFACQYDEIPRINSRLVSYSLNVKLDTINAVQPMRIARIEVEAQIPKKIKTCILCQLCTQRC
jgi:predicted transcriptional regulator